METKSAIDVYVKANTGWMTCTQLATLKMGNLKIAKKNRFLVFSACEHAVHFFLVFSGDDACTNLWLPHHFAIYLIRWVQSLADSRYIYKFARQCRRSTCSCKIYWKIHFCTLVAFADGCHEATGRTVHHTHTLTCTTHRPTSSSPGQNS